LMGERGRLSGGIVKLVRRSEVAENWRSLT
jgi:hypothetical protein